MKKFERLRSWILTFITDFTYEILIGLGSLVQTGDFTKAALISLGYASFRGAIRFLLEKQAKELKPLTQTEETL